MKRWGLACLVASGLAWCTPALGDEAPPRIEQLIRPLAERAPRWRCDIASRFVCTKVGCQASAGITWVELDFDARTYRRCDLRGCDRYPMQHAAGGIYTTASGGLQMYLKVLNDGSEFMESTAFGTSAFIGYGGCAPMP